MIFVWRLTTGFYFKKKKRDQVLTNSEIRIATLLVLIFTMLFLMSIICFVCTDNVSSDRFRLFRSYFLFLSLVTIVLQRRHVVVK